MWNKQKKKILVLLCSQETWVQHRSTGEWSLRDGKYTSSQKSPKPNLLYQCLNKQIVHTAPTSFIHIAPSVLSTLQSLPCLTVRSILSTLHPLSCLCCTLHLVYTKSSILSTLPPPSCLLCPLQLIHSVPSISSTLSILILYTLHFPFYSCYTLRLVLSALCILSNKHLSVCPQCTLHFDYTGPPLVCFTPLILSVQHLPSCLHCSLYLVYTVPLSCPPYALPLHLCCIPQLALSTLHSYSPG